MSGQFFNTGSLGGSFTNNKLTMEVRHLSQPLQKFRQFTQPEPAAGKRGGDKVFYDIISNIATAGGTIAETDTVPKSNFTITQGTLTLTERANSIPYTFKLETLSDIEVPSNIRITLANDMATVMDSAAAAEFQTSDYKATIETTASTVFASAGVAGTAAGANMSDKNVRDIVDRMKILNIPAFDNSGRYIAVCSTNSIRGVYDFVESKILQTDFSPLAVGEIGEYYKVRFIEETNALSNVLNSSYGEAVFFGADAVRQGVAVMDEIRVKLAQDFGRDQGLAWYNLIGFKKVWDYSTDGSTRIIHVTST